MKENDSFILFDRAGSSYKFNRLGFASVRFTSLYHLPRAGQYLNTLYLNTVFKYIYCIYTLYLNTFFNLYLITVFKYILQLVFNHCI